jgi:hypothetical protein
MKFMVIQGFGIGSSLPYSSYLTLQTREPTLNEPFAATRNISVNVETRARVSTHELASGTIYYPNQTYDAIIIPGEIDLRVFISTAHISEVTTATDYLNWKFDEMVNLVGKVGTLFGHTNNDVIQTCTAVLGSVSSVTSAPLAIGGSYPTDKSERKQITAELQFRALDNWTDF